MTKFTSIEICAGAGGQALGLEQAGFDHLALVEIDQMACQTLEFNRPKWNIVRKDVREFSASLMESQVDLLAGGVPCPPFSIAGKQLGEKDERDLFPEAVRLSEECSPKAIMLENVRGLLGPRFSDYRNDLLSKFEALGYKGEWRLLLASDFGVSQLRPRSILVLMKPNYWKHFEWPQVEPGLAISVGDLLFEQMASNGWKEADEWRIKANGIAPTLVGGSKKHGGADLGPTRARAAWLELGVDGKSLADTPPDPSFQGFPKLTVEMAALVQGFPKDWKFIGKKTPAYRQVGNAFPPPVAKAVGLSIRSAIFAEDNETKETRGKVQAERILS